MAGQARVAPGGLVYHVLNRAVARLRDWVRTVNTPLTAKELGRVRVSLARGRPYGEQGWQERMVGRLHLEHTVRGEGRPAKPPAEN